MTHEGKGAVNWDERVICFSTYRFPNSFANIRKTACAFTFLSEYLSDSNEWKPAREQTRGARVGVQDYVPACLFVFTRRTEVKQVPQSVERSRWERTNSWISRGDVFAMCAVGTFSVFLTEIGAVSRHSNHFAISDVERLQERLCRAGLSRRYRCTRFDIFRWDTSTLQTGSCKSSLFKRANSFQRH